MKKLIIFLILIMFIPLIMAETNIRLSVGYGDDFDIEKFAEFIKINGRDIEVEYVFKIQINNITLNTSNPELRFYFTKGEDKYFFPEIIHEITCQPNFNEGVKWGHNFDHIELRSCDNLINTNFSKTNQLYYFEIDKKDIKIDPLNPFIYFRINLIYEDFIIKKPDKRIFWQDLSISPKPENINRFLYMEKDSLISFLLNYKMIRYDFDQKKFILSFEEIGETQVFYKSENAENLKEIGQMVIAGIIAFFIWLLFNFFWGKWFKKIWEEIKVGLTKQNKWKKKHKHKKLQKK